MKVLCVIITLSVLCHCNALNYRLCQEKPAEKHCLIEYSVRYLWPHQRRYVFNWDTKRCYEIRWSKHCDPIDPHAYVNNFDTEEECETECGGWA